METREKRDALMIVPRRFIIAVACLVTVAMVDSGVASAKKPGNARLAESAQEATAPTGGFPAADLTAEADGFLPALERRWAETLGSARAELTQGRAHEALALLDSLKVAEILTDYVAYYRSVAFKQMEKYREALEALPADTAYGKKLAGDILWQRLDLMALTGKADDAVKLADTTRKAALRDRTALLKSAYFAGKALLLAGRLDEARQHFETVLVEYPGSEYDERILALLQKAGISVENVLPENLDNLRAERLIAEGYAHRGRLIYEKYARRDPKRYAERVAAALFKERRYPESAKAYAELLASGVFTTDRLELLTFLAQACARHDNFVGAMSANSEIIKSYPGSAEARRANAKLGFLLFDSGQYDKSAEFFSKNGSGGGKLRNQPRWYRLWSYYLSGKWREAAGELKGMLTNAGADTAMLNYWAGRVAENLSDKKAAGDFYAKADAADRKGYYGLLARQRLKFGGLKAKTLIHESLLDGVPSSINTARSGLSGAGLMLPAMLYHAGLDNHAFGESAGHAGSGAPALLALQSAGNYYRGLTVQKAAIAGKIKGCAAACGYALAYPRGYRKYVAPYAKHWRIDENLAFAIMRQESAFLPEVASWAFAHGLMQIIPPTAEEIAGRIGFAGYNTELLDQPRVNTLFGTYYISHLLRELHDEPVYAIAAYNAGPDAVGRWIKKLGAEEKDVFIELIPYTQTHEYVQRVLLNYLTYRKLYGGYR